VISRLLFISFLFAAVNAKATELDLSTPRATFKSCTFYQYDVIPLEHASDVISNCFTREGKIDLFANFLVGLLLLDVFEDAFKSLAIDHDESEQPTSKLDLVIDKYGNGEVDENFERNIMSLDEVELDALILSLIKISNDQNAPVVRPERRLLDLKVSDRTGKGTIASFGPEKENEHQISFKETSRGWLIDEISEFE